MNRTYGPKTIAFLSALASFFLVFLVNLFFTKQIWNSLIPAGVIFLFVYTIVLYYILVVLDKKIKVIYKLINQTKAGKKEQFYNDTLLPRPSLQDVTKDVEVWANKNEAAFSLLEKNEQYRKEFLQNLSHELKTPLFSMQGYVESLINGALHDKNVNQRFLENTSKNINRLIDLVNDLDAITKLENEKELLNYTIFNINELIYEVMNDLQLKATPKNIHLQFKENSLTNKKVKADKSKIVQVLTNLIDNSIKYGKDGGNVWVNIDALNNDSYIIEISDDGQGIGEEHIDRVFERFYRTDTARSRKIGGSGLGLAICKHIIEAHGQTIHVRSKVTVGTTFRFTLEKSS
jgi:two-component system, OmpR family, phosphate regulon sensor histidine kinase PhoR